MNKIEEQIEKYKKTNNKKIRILDLLDIDFVNYKEPTMNIAIGITCTFKCGKELCQNQPLCQIKPKEIEIEKILKLYTEQEITKSITLQGLEPLDNLVDVLTIIREFRKTSNDKIIIWTGYKEEEIGSLIEYIKDNFTNIIIKVGRYIPNQKSHKDKILGVDLASDNQYAIEINRE